MKKIIALLFLSILSFSSFAQEEKEEENKEENEVKYPQDVNKKHELKLNAFSLIALSSFDVSYEYLINRHSSVGIDLFYNFNDSEDIFLREFSLTSY
jgi:hypothetical protein